MRIGHKIIKEKDYSATFFIGFLFVVLWGGICFTFAFLLYIINPLFGVIFGTASFILGLWKGQYDGFFKVEEIERVEHIIYEKK